VYIAAFGKNSLGYLLRYFSGSMDFQRHFAYLTRMREILLRILLFSIKKKCFLRDIFRNKVLTAMVFVLNKNMGILEKKLG